MDAELPGPADRIAVALVALAVDDLVDPLLDDAMTAAAIAAEAIPTLEPPAPLPPGAGQLLQRACVEFLIHLRFGWSSLASLQVLAGELSDRLRRCLGPATELRALRILFHAFSRLPTTATDGLVGSLPPDPTRPVEAAIAGWLEDPAAREPVRVAIARGEVVAPVLDAALDGRGLAVQLLPVRVAGRPCVVVCTGTDRFAEVVDGAGPDVERPPTVTLTGAELVRICPEGCGVAVNPGTPLTFVLDPDEVAGLPRRQATRSSSS